MSIPVFPVRRDNELLAWSANWSQKINLNAVLYGLDAAQCAGYQALHDLFAASYAAVTNPNTNSKQAVIRKNAMRAALLDAPNGAWELVNIVQAFPGTTDSMRGELGLRIQDAQRTPVAAPATAPGLSILSAGDRTVTVRLRDPDNPDRRGKPLGAEGATVLYYIGEIAPPDPRLWMFARNTSKTVFDVEIPASAPAGSRVWLTAFWFNARMDASSPATPQSTRVIDGLARAA